MRKPGPREIKYSVQVTWLLNGRLRLDPSFVIWNLLTIITTQSHFLLYHFHSQILKKYPNYLVNKNFLWVDLSNPYILANLLK